jgi:predicted small lipoprotein YifL
MQSNVIMKTKIVRLFLLAAICCMLNGCGTKGPLYIPEQQYPQDTSAKN